MENKETKFTENAELSDDELDSVSGGLTCPTPRIRCPSSPRNIKRPFSDKKIDPLKSTQTDEEVI